MSLVTGVFERPLTSAGRSRDALNPPLYSNASWPQTPTDPPARSKMVTAFYIHQVVLALRRTLTEQGVSQSELADRLGVSAETLGRKIRGETWAGLTDILSWALELGVDLLPVPAEREELLPLKGH
mgnify:CR=1 FL=1